MSTIDMFNSQIVAQNVINGADSFPLMAIPFFMLAGEVMNKGGLAKRIVNVALVAVGHFRGGLGYVTIMAACILSSLSGSAAADAAALAALLVPMMVAAGHKKTYAAGLVAAGGVIAPRHPAQHRLRHLRRRRRRVDLKAVSGRYRSRPAARRRASASPGGGWCARRT